jgi:hypothetical protein
MDPYIHDKDPPKSDTVPDARERRSIGLTHMNPRVPLYRSTYDDTTRRYDTAPGTRERRFIHLPHMYNNIPLITPSGIRPNSMLLYTVLGIRPHREIQHQIYINNSILVWHPPQRKYTLPELKRLLLSSLVTNHAPLLL